MFTRCLRSKCFLSNRGSHFQRLFREQLVYRWHYLCLDTSSGLRLRVDWLISVTLASSYTRWRRPLCKKPNMVAHGDVECDLCCRILQTHFPWRYWSIIDKRGKPRLDPSTHSDHVLCHRPISWHCRIYRYSGYADFLARKILNHAFIKQWLSHDRGDGILQRV